MEVKSSTIHISDSIGSVSAEAVLPEQMKAMMTLAHGAGAGMNHRFMKALSNALADKNIGTVRFNFPFTEQGKKRPDFAPVAEKTIEVAIDYVTKEYKDVPLFASGKSFGGRMTSQFISKNEESSVRGLIFFGFPLHPAGKPGTERAVHLASIHKPMLFLQGTRDALATWDLIEYTCSSLSTATLEKIEGADHGFLIGKKECIPLLAEISSAWIASILKNKI